MSNKAITKNDLAAVLNEVLPPTPSEYKKLLWTNPSPTSSFAAQTIPLDLSNYDAIEIIIRSDTANTYTLAPIVTEVGKGGIAFNSTAYNSGRQFTTTTSGITFTAATYYSSYGNWSTTSTNALIPIYIYGIKYERVAPPQVEYPTYSTEEQEVGTWVTGKPLYRKVLQYSSMPNNTTAVYAHNIANMDIVVRFSCCWWDSTDGRFLMSPRIDSSTVNVRCSINKTNIVLEAIGTNWSTRTSDVNVIVEYTKTTD